MGKKEIRGEKEIRGKKATSARVKKMNGILLGFSQLVAAAGG